jgi:hypothetical protein
LFIIFRANVWERVIGNYSNADDLNRDMAVKLGVNGSLATESWYNDQWAATYGLLREGICTVAETSATWFDQRFYCTFGRFLQLKSLPSFNDECVYYTK